MTEHLLTYYLRINGNYVQDWQALDVLTLQDQKRYCLHILQRLEKLLPQGQERVLANLQLTIHQLELYTLGKTSVDALRLCAEMMCAQDRMAERYDKDANIPNLVSWCCEEAVTPDRTYPAWNLGALACAAHKRAGEHANVTAWGIGGLVQVCNEHMAQRNDLERLVMQRASDHYEQEGTDRTGEDAA